MNMTTNEAGSPRRVPRIFIGVAGGTGSGKTTVVKTLVHELSPRNVAVIHHDSYYRDRSRLPVEERQSVNYDHPESLETELLLEHLGMLRNGNPVEVPTYNFTNHERRAETKRVTPKPVIIVEGILILCEPGLRKLLDLSVFVDTDDDIRLIRRLERDLRERGRSLESVIAQYVESVKPMHDRFVAPSRRHADLIIPEGGQNRVAIDVLISSIRNSLRSASPKKPLSKDKLPPARA